MLRTLLVAGVFGTGLVASAYSRFAALLLYLWFAFFRPDQWMYLDISALRPSLVLALVLVIPALLSGKYPNLSHPLSLGSIVFFVAALLGQTGAFSPETGWLWLDYLGKLLIVALLTITLVDTRERFLLAVMVIGCSFGFHAAKAGLASLLAGGLRFTEGPGGAFIDNNGYALGMAMIAPFLICVAQNASWKFLRVGCLISAPLIVFAVISTYSRAGFLAIAAAALVFVSFQRRRFAWLFLVVLLALPVSMFMSRQAGYLDRLQTITTYEEENEVSALGRLHFWSVAAAIVSDRPFGVGLFNYEAAYDRYDSLHGQFGQRRSVHSSHFQVLAETGLLGAAAWLFLFGYAYLVAFRTRRRAQLPGVDPKDARTWTTGANALIASMTAFVVGGAFIALALNDLTWITFALIASLDRISLAALAARTATAPAPAMAAASQFGWPATPAAGSL